MLSRKVLLYSEWRSTHSKQKDPTMRQVHDRLQVVKKNGKL